MEDISFQKISGYIEPVLVEIDTIQQSINLPEDFENFDFSNISMRFDFQSSLTLPSLINLELSSFNEVTGASFTKIISGINISENPNFEDGQH